jgi:hypothetical protein
MPVCKILIPVTCGFHQNMYSKECTDSKTGCIWSKKFKVMDTCCATPCTATADISTCLRELRQARAKDGVHFVHAGYKNLAERCLSSLHTLRNMPVKSSTNSVHLAWIQKSTRVPVNRSSHRSSTAATSVYKSRARTSTWHQKIRLRPCKGYHPYHRFYNRFV